MKTKILFITTLLLIVGCSQEPINYETTLVERNGVFYTKDTNQPYSGPVFSLDKKGRNKREGILKDGKMISHKDFEWYENGQTKWEVTFKDGKENGLRTYFGNDGKEYKGIFVGKKNGYVLGLTNFKDGKKELYTEWYDGDKMTEITYKGGKYDETYEYYAYDGTTTRWFENGQKSSEETRKDGELNRLYWYKDGQKNFEGTYKDGELINIIGRWNEDGSVRKEPFSWE